MGREWKEVTLGELFSVKHGFAFKGEHFTDKPTKTVCVTPGNFSIGGGFKKPKPKYYDGPVPEEYILQPGDIVVTMTDLSKQADTLGLAASIPDDGIVWLHNQRIGLLKFKTTHACHPEFINYLLRTHGYRSWVVGSATGTTVKHTSPSRIHSYSCFIPAYEEQRRIANVLGALDDKIELNRQINTTLESMTQALFKSWFVDFDPVIDNAFASGNRIPDELQAKAQRRAALGALHQPLPAEIRQIFPASFVFDEDMGWLPEGWGSEKLAKVISLIIDHRGKTPTKMGGKWSDSGYPAISAKNVKDGKIIREDAIKYVDKELYKRWMKEPLKVGDVALTSEAPMGELFLFSSSVEYVLSQRLFAIRANPEFISGSYLYFWLNTSVAKSDMKNRSTGTTVVGIRQSELQKVKVLTPGLEAVLAFDKYVGSMLQSVDKTEQEISSLIKIRDSLLPKLLSGQIQVPEVEQQLTEVI